MHGAGLRCPCISRRREGGQWRLKFWRSGRRVRKHQRFWRRAIWGQCGQTRANSHTRSAVPRRSDCARHLGCGCAMANLLRCRLIGSLRRDCVRLMLVLCLRHRFHHQNPPRAPEPGQQGQKSILTSKHIRSADGVAQERPHARSYPRKEVRRGSGVNSQSPLCGPKEWRSCCPLDCVV